VESLRKILIPSFFRNSFSRSFLPSQASFKLLKSAYLFIHSLELLLKLQSKKYADSILLSSLKLRSTFRFKLLKHQSLHFFYSSFNLIILTQASFNIFRFNSFELQSLNLVIQGSIYRFNLIILTQASFNIQIPVIQASIPKSRYPASISQGLVSRFKFIQPSKPGSISQ
jgi:hypothetical protein